MSVMLDPRQRRIGTANLENVQRTLTSLAIVPFTQRLGMNINEVKGLVERASGEAANPALKAYFPMYVCIGKKVGG
ncbi:MAG: hypothetical protein Q9163_004558 [Psora crenata]